MIEPEKINNPSLNFLDRLDPLDPLGQQITILSPHRLYFCQKFGIFKRRLYILPAIKQPGKRSVPLEK